jgi:hypothetical protein
MATTEDQKINISETANLLATSTHLIPLDDAAGLTANFRTSHNNDPATIRGGYFSRGIIDQILAQSGCVGIRYYYGLDATNQPCLVLTGVDASDNDQYNETLAEMAIACPPRWPAQYNPLNPNPNPTPIP